MGSVASMLLIVCVFVVSCQGLPSRNVVFKEHTFHYCSLFRNSLFLERCGIISGNWIFWKEDRASSKGTLCFPESSCCRGLTSWKKHCNASCYIDTLCIEHCTFVPGKIRLAEYAEKKT